MEEPKNPRTIWADNTPKYIAYATNVAFVAYIISLFVFAIPDGNRDLIIAASGALLVGWNSINNYFYNSSAQSDARAAVRTNVIAEVESKRDPNTTPPDKPVQEPSL